MKKFILKYSNIILFCFLAVALFLPAKSVDASDGWGKHGENVSWYFHENTGLLEITGTGDMDTISHPYYAPWRSYSGSIKKVVIGEGITSVSGQSFARYYGALEEVVLPSTVTYIGYQAFDGCGVRSINLPNGLTAMGDMAFYNCASLTSIVIPSSLKIVPSFTFSGCSSITSITISHGVEELRSGAFSKTSISSIYIPSTVKVIHSAFSGCQKLEAIEIPSSVTSVGNEMCFSCSNLKYVIFNGQCTIPKSAFGGCDKLEAVKIGEGVTGIGYFTFWSDRNLKYMYIPSSVTSIDGAAFYGGSESVTFYGYAGSKAWEFAGLKNNINFVDVSTAAGQAAWNTAWESATAVELTKENTIVSLSNSSYEYDGKVKAPTAVVVYNGKTLTNGVDYTLSYSAGRKNVGKYTVTITFKGSYKGNISKSFTIKPASTKIKGLKKGRKSFTVTWRKKKKQVSGYQIQYSLKKNFSNKKTKTIRSSKITKLKVSKLKTKKKYYVKIRTYKKVGKTKYYSAWSTPKTVRTK